MYDEDVRESEYVLKLNKGKLFIFIPTTFLMIISNGKKRRQFLV